MVSSCWKENKISCPIFMVKFATWPRTDRKLESWLLPYMHTDTWGKKSQSASRCSLSLLQTISQMANAGLSYRTLSPAVCFRTKDLFCCSDLIPLRTLNRVSKQFIIVSTCGGITKCSVCIIDQFPRLQLYVLFALSTIHSLQLLVTYCHKRAC